MGNVKNSEYSSWSTRLNNVREKHGLSKPNVSSPGNVVATADKMNALLSNMSMSSKWINDSIGDRVTKSAFIYQSLADKINEKLTYWESICIHNTVFSANFSTNRSVYSNYTDYGDDSGDDRFNSTNCSSNLSHYGEYANYGNCSVDSSDWNYCSGDEDWSCGDDTDWSHDSDCTSLCFDNGDDADYSSHDNNCSFYSTDDSFNTTNFTNNAVS